MKTREDEISSVHFDLNQLACFFPECADTLLLDRYLVNREAASARIFRVYHGTPPHYHAGCDEYLYVLSGNGTFWMEDPKNSDEFAPGSFFFFRKGTVHALPNVFNNPVVLLSIDVPRRHPKDIIFINPAEGSPERFIQETK